MKNYLNFVLLIFSCLYEKTPVSLLKKIREWGDNVFSRIDQLIFDNEAVAKTSDFTMGLEIEMQRVDEDGNLSLEPYPSAIGDEKTNPWITNDFLETMAEMVTPSAQHALDAMHYLYVINNTLRSALAPGELLWPLSMPPRLPKDKTKLRLAKKEKKKVLSDIDGSLRIFMVQAQLLKKIILNREKSCLIRFGACGKVNTALEPNLPVILLISIVTLHGLKKELKQGF